MIVSASNRRWVVHLDMDAFFASVEQLTRPTLRGRPVLVGGLGQRGVVAGASYEARASGPRSAMPMTQARRLLPPNGVVLPARFHLYEVMSQRVFAIVAEHAPVLENVSLDETFAQPPTLVGAKQSDVEAFAAALREQITEATGLTASVGAGSGKQVAKIASGKAKPDGVLVVPHGEERTFLSDLPVRALWGIGPVAEERLRALGILTIGQFADLPGHDVASLLGSVGTDLQLLATGVDERPVARRGDAKQVSAETTFETDITELAELRAEIVRITESVHARLLKSSRAARTVTVKLRHTDMSVASRSATASYPTTDIGELTIMVERLLPDPTEFGPVRLAGVGFSGLTEQHQEALFPLHTSSESSARVVSAPAKSAPSRSQWRPGDDVFHPRFGHGWIQGCGIGKVTIRFETRSTGPGIARTFADDDSELVRGDALNSLD